jgi:hypothetical protein
LLIQEVILYACFSERMIDVELTECVNEYSSEFSFGLSALQDDLAGTPQRMNSVIKSRKEDEQEILQCSMHKTGLRETEC